MHSVEPHDPKVDELRQRLRELGYLDASVDRFLLGPMRRTRGPLLITLLASLRIGVLAAVLLGPSAAVGLIARVPGLITGPRDGMVAAVYLGVFFGLAVTGIAFLSALLASWAATRRGRIRAAAPQRIRGLSIAAGLLVSAASLAYFTLWWRTADSGIQSLAWTVLALIVAVAISVTLGHAVTLTAMAVTIAQLGEAMPPRAPVQSWRASIAGGALAFIGASALLFAVSTDRPHPDRPPLTIASSGARVIVIAIDGFDLPFYERLLATTRSSPAPPEDARIERITEGVLPWFNDARADLAHSDSTDPARLWTSVATSVRPDTHGVASLETRHISGLQGILGEGSTARVIGAASDILRLTRPAIASNFERRVKTFWEVAEEAGLRTAVVNWWATWPAPASGGIVVSDRAVLRLERGGTLDAEVEPRTLYEHLRSQWPRIQESTRRDVAATLAREPLFGEHDPLKDKVKRSAELDAAVIQLAETVDANNALDLLVVYLPGLDIAQQTLLAEDTSAPPSELNVRIAALAVYYGLLHRLTDRLLGTSQARVFLIAQPGRLHQGAGIMAVKGPGFQTRVRVRGTALDVGPTILHAIGLPIARDLDGSVLSGLFTPESLMRLPVRYVSTYGQRGAVSVTRGNQPLDQEAIDRLRSLGYIR
jgi:hypothetical protein